MKNCLAIIFVPARHCSPSSKPYCTMDKTSILQCFSNNFYLKREKEKVWREVSVFVTLQSQIIKFCINWEENWTSLVSAWKMGRESGLSLGASIFTLLQLCYVVQEAAHGSQCWLGLRLLQQNLFVMLACWVGSWTRTTRLFLQT